jgi:hypothetical protein
MGTLGGFLVRSVQETEGKREKAAVSLTVDLGRFGGERLRLHANDGSQLQARERGDLLGVPRFLRAKNAHTHR